MESKQSCLMTFSLDTRLLAELKEMAKKMGVSASELIRQAVKDRIEREKA